MWCWGSVYDCSHNDMRMYSSTLFQHLFQHAVPVPYPCHTVPNEHLNVPKANHNHAILVWRWTSDHLPMWSRACQSELYYDGHLNPNPDRALFGMQPKRNAPGVDCHKCTEWAPWRYRSVRFLQKRLNACKAPHGAVWYGSLPKALERSLRWSKLHSHTWY